MFFPCDRVLLHHLPLLQIPDGFRPSDTGCQSTLQCVQRKFPVAVSAVQQFKILGIRAAKPPVLVHHISDAWLCLFHAVPVQVPDRKLKLLLVSFLTSKQIAYFALKSAISLQVFVRIMYINDSAVIFTPREQKSRNRQNDTLIPWLYSIAIS